MLCLKSVPSPYCKKIELNKKVKVRCEKKKFRRLQWKAHGNPPKRVWSIQKKSPQEINENVKEESTLGAGLAERSTPQRDKKLLS